MLSNEWEPVQYKYESTILSTSLGSSFSNLVVTVKLVRSHSFYEITLFCPVVLMAVLSVIGIILPVDSGEKMGFGVTMLLSLVVYLDLMREEIPVWAANSSASLLIWLFIVSIVVIAISLVQQTCSISMHLISDDEVRNYGPTR